MLSFSSFFSLAAFLCRRRGEIVKGWKINGGGFGAAVVVGGNNGCQKLSKLSLAVELSEETVELWWRFGACVRGCGSTFHHTKEPVGSCRVTKNKL